MKNTKKLIQAAVLTALACVLTIVPKVPIGGGYVHFGDTVIYIAAILLGPIYGAAVGALFGLYDILYSDIYNKGNNGFCDRQNRI